MRSQFDERDEETVEEHLAAMDDDNNDDDGDEEAIAARAVLAWDEIEGDDEVAQAAREALVLVAHEALAMKQARSHRDREARCAEIAHATERRAERERAEAAARAQRWEAERRARDARLAAVERNHARLPSDRRVETQAPPRVGHVGHRAADMRPSDRELPGVPAPPATRPPAVARAIARVETPDVGSHKAAHPGHDARPEPPAAPSTATPAEMKPGEQHPASEEPDRFLCESVAPTLTGADLAAWRARHGLTQQAAADRLGVRQGTVSKAESRGDAALGPALQGALAERMRER